MKVYNIDYLASTAAVQIVAIKGFTSEEQATAAPKVEAHARLQARSSSDIASLGEPVQAALWAFKAKKDQGMPADGLPEAIWALLEPPKKDRRTGLTAPRTDGTSSSSPDEKAGSTEGQKPGKRKTMAKAKKKAAKKKATKAKNGTSAPRGEKTLKVKALLERAKGCTSAEVKEMTGWPAVSMPAMAKACGLKLRKEKVKGKPTQYFGS